MESSRRQKYSRWDKEGTKELMRLVLTDQQMRNKMEALICKQFPEMQKKRTKLSYGFVKKLASKVGVGIKDSRGLSIKLINIAKSLHCKSELKELLERGWHAAERLGLLEKNNSSDTIESIQKPGIDFGNSPKNDLEDLLEEICLQIHNNHTRKIGRRIQPEKSTSSRPRDPCLTNQNPCLAYMNPCLAYKSPCQEPLDFAFDVLSRAHISPGKLSRINWDFEQSSDDADLNGQKYELYLLKINSLPDQRDQQLFGDLLSSTRELHDRKFRENPVKGQYIMGLFYQCIDRCLPSECEK